MALVQCPECGCERSSDARACPHCGKPVYSVADRIIALSCFLFVGGTIVVLLKACL